MSYHIVLTQEAQKRRENRKRAAQAKRKAMLDKMRNQQQKFSKKNENALQKLQPQGDAVAKPSTSTVDMMDLDEFVFKFSSILIFVIFLVSIII